MSDEELSKYVLAYGDRIALMAFAKCKIKKESNSGTTLATSTLHQLGRRNNSRQAGNKNDQKKSHKLELGWLNFTSAELYKQVRAKSGGGTRHFPIDKNVTVNNILHVATATFFPGGVSKLGHLTDFDCKIKDFKGDSVPDEKNIEDLYRESHLKTLRLYLYTRSREQGVEIRLQEINDAHDNTDQGADVSKQKGDEAMSSVMSVQYSSDAGPSDMSVHDLPDLPDVTVTRCRAHHTPSVDQSVSSTAVRAQFDTESGTPEEGVVAQPEPESEPRETPQKSLLPTVLFSTPGTSGITQPAIEASDISGVSESEQSESARSEDSLVKNYQKKAQDADSSFMQITFEVSEDEDIKKLKDVSYHPSPLSEEEWEEDEESDIDDDYEEDFTLNMTIREDDIADLSSVPVSSVADKIIDVSDNEDEDPAEEDIQPAKDRNLVEEKKFICFETELRMLAGMKPVEKCSTGNCDAAVSIVVKYTGTSVQLKWICTRNHCSRTWNSQPLIKKVKAGDFLLSGAVLCSGNNFNKIQLMFKFLSLGIVCQSTHNQIQAKHTTVVIEQKFSDMIRRNREKYRGKEIVVAGDGRMDSPGHSAQYCTYTLLEYESKDIVACEIIDKRMTAMKSTNMEKEGLVRALKSLSDSGVVVKELCTDASTSIAAMIRKEHPTVVHTFDTWHGAKNFGKKLGGVAAETKNKDLRPWVPDIINHFWYCSRMADGGEDAILARWRGALHHVTDVHEWALGDHAIEPRCDHDQITEDKEWLEPGGNSHLALTRVMLDVRFLRSLKHFVNFRHTGELETFHEHILMYAAKRFAYKYPTYKARNYLAALDYTEHSDRPVIFNKDGQPRLHRSYSKRNGNWTCYQEKEPKKYNHVSQILKDVIESYLVSKVPLRAKVELQDTDPRRIKRHLSGESPPPTKHLMSAKKSRF